MVVQTPRDAELGGAMGTMSWRIGVRGSIRHRHYAAITLTTLKTLKTLTTPKNYLLLGR